MTLVHASLPSDHYCPETVIFIGAAKEDAHVVIKLGREPDNLHQKTRL